MNPPTIYALSTHPGKAAIAVLRVSGPASSSIYTSLTHRHPPKPRQATVSKLWSNHTLLDESLCLFFRAPKSYTGEDLLELQVHGGNAVVNAVTKTISSLHTSKYPIRYAEPGEFSKRGFQNGRFDLTEAEGINELINAETEAQRASVLGSVKGETKQMFQRWSKEILQNVALLTTIIDFGEEHNLEEVDSLFNKVARNVGALEKEVAHYLDRTRKSQVLMDGIRLTLIGPPNAGKSSLLNTLADDDMAIVSSIAGTTRDAIEVPMSIGGYKVIVGDTAGIRQSTNEIEQQGIAKAKNKSHAADINVVMVSIDQPIEQTFIDHIGTIKDRELLVVVNKCDLSGSKDANTIANTLQVDPKSIRFISCKTGEGIDQLEAELGSKFKEITWSGHEEPVSLSERAQDILEKDVLQGFKDFDMYKQTGDVVLACEALRFAMEGIGKITGETVGVEDILGVVFSQFCIGK